MTGPVCGIVVLIILALVVGLIAWDIAMTSRDERALRLRDERRERRRDQRG